MTNPMETGVVSHASPLGFEATLQRIVAAIEKAGLRIFARIDHADGAREAGLAMPPAVVLIYGHAKGGTPIMLAVPETALDLPLRVLIYEDADSHVSVAFRPIGPLLLSFGVPEPLASRLAPAQRLLLEALQS